MERRVTLSLGILAYNEREYLEGMLEQVTNYVDEIILVDSYSTDGSIELAESYSAKIIQKEFTSSFANIRNEVVNNCTSDYILVLDADERLEDPDILNMLEYTVDGYIFPRKNYIDGNFIDWAYPDYHPIIFRNNSNIKYKGNVHEQLCGLQTTEYVDSHVIHEKTNAKQQRSNIRYSELIGGK